MFLKDIDPNRLSLLSPEQLKVVERWNKEAEERAKIIPELCAAYNVKAGLARELADELEATDAEYCEHGRHKDSAHCMACEEIEEILFPELYTNDTEI